MNFKFFNFISAVVEPGEILLIHNISRYCGGTYECIAFNGVDKADSHQIEVEVICKYDFNPLLIKRMK